MGFYLKLTTEEANQLISEGIQALFNGIPEKFQDYTYYIEDIATGDKYWRVENLQYRGVFYDIVGFLDQNYPALTRYSYDAVKQFIV